MKKTIFLPLLFALSTAATAQVKSTVAIESGERWWGGATGLGSAMPYVKPVAPTDQRTVNYNNQTAPFWVSNYGRYIFSNHPAKWGFDGKSFIFDAPEAIVVTKAGKNLREAFVIATDAHFKPTGQMPPAIFFDRPQFNTWIELIYDQNQADIEAYAEAIIKNGFNPGVLMIDDNWQRYYGNFDFRAEKFPDARAMIDKLHKLGFKVMVWICPFVSADSPEYRDLAERGFLVKGADGRAHITEWWNGFSAVYDLLNPAAVDYLEQQLVVAQEKYGIDGFKFDAGDVQFYDVMTSNAQCAAWQSLANRFEYSELRASWGGRAERAAQRLGDKDYSWGALQLLIPDMIAASMIGYPYICPDMIGGGQFGSFRGVDRSKLDQKLIVRWAQASAAMPMMQFSVAPWNVLDAQNLEYVVKAAQLHEKFAPYILELATAAAKTGEPIVRPMEYHFPKAGFSDCKDQFMLGDRYIVAPVVTADDKRVVRLPRGTWFDDKGKRYRGPLVMEVTVAADRLLYFEAK